MTKLIFLRRVQDLSDYMQGVSIPPHEYTRAANMYIHSLSIHPSNRDPSLYAAVRSLIASAREYTCVITRLRAQAEEEESMVRTKLLYALTPSPHFPLRLLHLGQQRKSGQPPPNSQPQGYPLGMTQQALLQTSLAFRSHRSAPFIEGNWLSEKSGQDCKEECKRAEFSI